MRSLEKTGRSVDEALAEALAELQVTRDAVSVEVVDEGGKGLFGLLGNKQARIRVTVIEPAMEAEAQREPEAELEPAAHSQAGAESEPVPSGEAQRRGREFLQGVLDRMGLETAVETRVDDDGIVHMNITGSKLGMVIGRRGQTLDALQYLINLAANRGQPVWTRMVLDAEGYRERRAETLRGLARRMADKAKTQGRKATLDPMSALERRVVHMALQDDDTVETHSEGEDPYRRVVIIAKQR